METYPPNRLPRPVPVLDGPYHNEQKQMRLKYRFKLKARMLELEFKHQYEFAKKNGIDVGTLSRILSGREIPTPRIQNALCTGLGLTEKQLWELLDA